MPEPETGLSLRSLILYKNRPGRVLQLGKKRLEIEVKGGQTLKVRPKDVACLHPGPIDSLAELRPLEGEVETAWELLAGESTNLPELAELIYGSFTPASAWATWQLVDDGFFFSGTPELILAHDPAAVAQERAARQAKAAEKQAWADFSDRVARGAVQPEDGRYLKEIEALTQGRLERSRVLRELGHAETPEGAHALLLSLGYWSATVNPYPSREGVLVTSPDLPLPDLLEEERRDLTHLPALAIDDEGNRDPDDALSLENGRLWVHIADAAALVSPDSPADLEARARGANLYLPEGAVTMLPQEATRVLGLGLAEISPALSFGLDLAPDGEITCLEIVPSWVRVTRLTYEEAEVRLNEPLLQRLHNLAESYEARRRRNGAIEIDLPEVKVEVEEGKVFIRRLPPLRSRDLVREAMLMTGEAVARFALERDIPVPFTVQDVPDEDPQADGNELIAPSPAAMFALRRRMRRGRQQITPAAHTGLGMALYVQATSPLRRYLDLVVHQQLRAFLRGDAVLDGAAVMERVGAADAITWAVRRAERRSIAHWTLVYLLQHPEWRGEGVVVDKRGARVVVLIPELALETQIYLRQEAPLNQRLSLALDNVNLAAQEARFRVLAKGERMSLGESDAPG